MNQIFLWIYDHLWNFPENPQRGEQRKEFFLFERGESLSEDTSCPEGTANDKLGHPWGTAGDHVKEAVALPCATLQMCYFQKVQYRLTSCPKLSHARWALTLSHTLLSLRVKCGEEAWVWNVAWENPKYFLDNLDFMILVHLHLIIVHCLLKLKCLPTKMYQPSCELPADMHWKGQFSTAGLLSGTPGFYRFTQTICLHSFNVSLKLREAVRILGTFMSLVIKMFLMGYLSMG